MNKKILLIIITVSFLLAGCGKVGSTDTTQQNKQSPSVASTTNNTVTKSQGVTTSNVTNDPIDYNQYVKKTWIESKDSKSQVNGVSFSISSIENGKITGELTIVGPAPSCANTVANLNGTVNKNTAECQFTDSRENKGTIKLVFKPNDTMEATISLTYKIDSIAQPPEGTFQFTPYNLNNIKGFSPIENQSFMVNLNSWGNVKFVSGIYLRKDYVPLAFYLTNKEGDIVYDFDSIPNSQSFTGIEVKAVSFADVNKDGLKDIIIIVDHKVATGNDISTEHTAAVYLQKPDGSFTIDEKLNQEINADGNNKDIKTITNYLSQKF